jgi:hypothetical protein
MTGSPVPITGPLVDFFEADDWPVVFDANLGCYVARFQGSQATWTCKAYALDEESRFVFYSIAPVHADEAHRDALLEYLMRANDGLIIGSFELSFSTGEIRFRTSVDVDEATLEQPIIKHLIYANVQAMDRYLGGMMLVLADGASPEDAIARAERPEDGQ